MRQYCLDDSTHFRWIELSDIDSTNLYLRKYRPQVEVSLTLATAEYQTAGRGAGNNHWESQRGKNLLFSLRWLPTDLPASRVFSVSEALALAICHALDDFAPGFTVKWPNDIYHGNHKVAGTLIENDLQGKNISSSILGTGINVNQTTFLSDAPNPLSLAQILGHEVERLDVLQGVMHHFSHYRQMLECGEYEALHTEYLSRIYLWHRPHTYRDTNGNFMASITNILPDGHLVLTDAEGTERRYAFKEVELIHTPSGDPDEGQPSGEPEGNKIN